jgi:hypothetical protein
MSSFLDIALSHAALGLYVFPVAKNKSTLGGHGHKDASIDPVRIRSWWAETPSANPGFSPGPSDVAVVDLDHGLTDMASFIAWRDRNGIPATYTVRSGSRPEFKVHMYFRGAIDDIGKWVLDGCSGQVKSLGGYVLAAGSEALHGEKHDKPGAPYEAIDGTLGVFAPTPDVVRQLRKPATAPSNNSKVPKTAWSLPVHETENRTGFLLEQTGAMRNLGCGKDAIFARMIELNADPEIIADPVDDARLERTAVNCAKFPVPGPVPVVTIGGPKAEPLEIAEKHPRPVFPDAAWTATIFGEFAEIVCRGNFIRKRLASESFRAITGAIAGDQVTCGIAGVRMREYLTLIANPQAGKSYGLDCAVTFYTTPSARNLFEPMLMLHGGHNRYRTSGIGAQRFLPGSSNSFVDELTRDSKPKTKKQIKKEITETDAVELGPLWKPTARLITIQGEAMALFARLCSPDWTGQALSALVTDLYDSLDAEVAVTKERAAPKIPVQMQYSMVLCTQPQIWRKYMAAHMMDSGLFGRFYIVGSEYKPTKVLLPDYSDAKLFQEHFGALRRDVFARLDYLRDHPLRLTIAPAARQRLTDWENALPDTDELDRDLSSRMGLHAWRAAMARAWGAMPQRTEITVEDADAAIRLSEYQVKMRQYYAPTPGDSPKWRHLNAVKAAIEQAGQITVRDLRRKVNGDHFPEDFDWALAYLEKRGLIVSIPGKRKNQTVYAWVRQP